MRVCSEVQGLPCSLLEELLLATFGLRPHDPTSSPLSLQTPACSRGHALPT